MADYDDTYSDDIPVPGIIENAVKKTVGEETDTLSDDVPVPGNMFATDPSAIDPDFMVSNPDPDAMASVQFTDLSTENPDSWHWEFGDGGESFEQHPVYEYDTAGVYTVTLTASKSGSGWHNDAVVTKTDLVTVHPVAAFSADPRLGLKPLTALFTNESLGHPTSLHWLFGDGAESYEENPEHEYTEGGVYTVTLTVSRSGLEDVEIKAGYVIASNLECAFFGNLLEGERELSVNFTDQSVFAVRRRWDFGDGHSSYEENPAHTYRHVAAYTVRLTVWDMYEISTFVEKVNYVTVKMQELSQVGELVNDIGFRIRDPELE